MKRFTCVAAALVLASALAFAGCGQATSESGSSAPLAAKRLEQAASASAAQAQSEDAASESTAAEPESGQDAASAAPAVEAGDVEVAVKTQVEAYAREAYGMTGDIVVVADVVAVDGTDASDVKAFGCFGAYAFSDDGGTFVLQSASEDAGAVHLAASGGGYTATSCEYAEDGAGHDESLQRICAGNESAYGQLAAASIPEDELTAAVAAYAQENGLNIEAYETAPGERTSF